MGGLKRPKLEITTRVVPKVKKSRAVLPLRLHSVTARTKIFLPSMLLIRSQSRDRDMVQFSLLVPPEITLLSLLGKYSIVPTPYVFTSADLD